MLSINKTLLSISLSAIAFTVFSGEAIGVTNQACEQKVFADLYYSAQLPSGLFTKLIAGNVHYSTLQASASADYSAQIQQLVTLRAGVPSLPLSQYYKNQFTASYTSQIVALRNAELTLAKSKCDASLRGQAPGVAAPHQFKRRGVVVYK
jgi:hypothetical protein